MWTAGLGQFGQLAQHETQDSPVFNPVTRLPYINPAYRNPSQIAVGNHHVVAMIPGDDVIAIMVSFHYSDVIMITMVSQITGVWCVYLTVCSGADQRKHQSSASLAFVKGFHRWPVNSPHQGPVIRKMFQFDDVIMNFVNMATFSFWQCSNDLYTIYFLCKFHILILIGVWSVYSAVCSGADQRKLQSSASLAFVRGIHRGPANSPLKGAVTRKIFPFDDVMI